MCLKRDRNRVDKPLNNLKSILKNNLEHISKTVLTFVSLALMTQGLSGQTSAQYYADSIIQLLDTIPDERDQIYFLKENGRNYLRVNDSIPFILNRKALDIGLESKDISYIGLAYEEKGVLLSILNQHEEARKPILESLKYFKQSKDSSRIGYGYRNLGITYKYTNQYDSAVTYLFKSLTYFDPDKEDDKLFYGLSLLELSKSFATTLAYRESLKYADMAIDALKSTERPSDLSGAYNSKSIALMNLPYDEHSVEFIEEALEYSVLRKDTGSYVVHLHNYALFLSKQ